ncbi:metallophosphoesterase [Parapedobacter sp. DT-150]|uniref:metallophosphoesterase n=1 Tax=Parapedobacter sp. DT-150 TaxID=3396162 RepID=UPI003F1B9653
MKHYLLTETEGFAENLKQVRRSQPDFVLLAGDLVQGGAYQRAWDEFLLPGRLWTGDDHYARFIERLA